MQLCIFPFRNGQLYGMTCYIIVIHTGFITDNVYNVSVMNVQLFIADVLKGPYVDIVVKNRILIFGHCELIYCKTHCRNDWNFCFMLMDVAVNSSHMGADECYNHAAGHVSLHVGQRCAHESS